MPLEGGVTAIVGPNGSGKSNITDAVLFALGEQSAVVLRAGAMSELIFSGSETLPAGAAEVTLVLDNASGEISLPYREVSLTRRISRAGDTEYRINGTRARLQDVRAVAGEAGIGRHSILRQGAVDAIVAGGAAACRLALEEAAGLGVYRRRRLSASRRLEKAASQLEQTRQLESELESQLRRMEREAAAAREYRDIEARYRELSLAHLYRIATRDMEGLERRLEEEESASRSSWPAGSRCAKRKRPWLASPPIWKESCARRMLSWRASKTAPKTCGASRYALTGICSAWKPGARANGGVPSRVSRRSLGGSLALWRAWRRGSGTWRRSTGPGARRRPGENGPRRRPGSERLKPRSRGQARRRPGGPSWAARPHRAGGRRSRRLVGR